MKQKEMVKYLNESDVIRLMKNGTRFSRVLDLELTEAIERLLDIEIHNGVMRGTYDRESVKHVIDIAKTKDHEYDYIINIKGRVMVELMPDAEYSIRGYAKDYDDALKTTMKLLHKAKKMDDALRKWQSEREYI